MTGTVRSTLVVWAMLMLSTTASTWGFSRAIVSANISTIAVLVIAAVKVGLVMAFFMGLRNAPLAWRLAGTIWVIGAASTIMIIYLL